MNVNLLATNNEAASAIVIGMLVLIGIGLRWAANNRKDDK